VIVESKVGGRFEILDLGIVLQPGEVVDLSFFAREEELSKSNELKRAFEKGCLKRVDPKVVPGNFRAATGNPLPAVLEDPVRRAIFEDRTLSVEAASYWHYVMRDLDTRRAIVTSTQDVRLLRDIIENESSPQIVATARGRLTRLQQAAGGE